MNQCLDKLATARVDFENCGMLKGSVLSAAIQEVELQHHGDDNTGENPDSEGSDMDNDIQMHGGPHILNDVRLAKTPGKSIIVAMF